MEFVRSRKSLPLVVFAWIALVAVVYYQRIWQLFLLGPIDWVADNPSLSYTAHALRVTWKAGLDGWSIFTIKEALARALIAILGAAAVFISTQTLGAGFCSLIRCKFDHGIEKFVYHAGMGFGILAYLSLGMAVLGVYRPGFMRFLVLGTAVIGILLFLLRFRGQEERLQGRVIIERLFKWKFSSWQVIALFAGFIALMGALAPEIEYDALWYHLWLPRLWLEQGSPVDLVNEYVSLYPLNWELVYGAGMVMGGPVTAKILSFSSLPLTAMIIYQVVRRYTSEASPWIAIAIWITTPTVLWEATTAYNDLVLGFYAMLIIYSAMRYTENREKNWLMLASLSVGFSLGIKHLALVILAVVSIVLALKLWLASRELKAVVLLLTIIGGIGFAIAFPWYARSWQASRNPVFPEFYGLFGAEPPERWDTITEHGLDEFKAHFGKPRTLSNLVTLPWDMTIHSAFYGGALGPIFLMFLPVLMVYRSRALLIPWLVLLAVLYILFWASPLSSFQMRFVVPIAPLLAVLVTEGVEQLRRAISGGLGKRVLELGIVVLCLLNLPPFLSLHEVDREEWDGWLTHVIHTVPLGVVFGQVSGADYLNQKVPSYAAWRYINTYLPADSRILTFSGGDHIYSHRERISSDAPIARDAIWMPERGDEEDMLEQLNLLGITHILLDKKQISDLEDWNLAIIQPEVISRWYIQEYEDNRFILYQLVHE